MFVATSIVFIFLINLTIFLAIYSFSSNVMSNTFTYVVLLPVLLNVSLELPVLLNASLEASYF